MSFNLYLKNLLGFPSQLRFKLHGQIIDSLRARCCASKCKVYLVIKGIRVGYAGR